jgi:hypothetical protein
MRTRGASERVTADRSDSRDRTRRVLTFSALLAGACTRAPEPATAPAAPVDAAEPAAPASDAPASEVRPPAAPTPETPVEAKSGPATGPRACKDGEALADGCRCDGKTCMDICCVGSACSHHASPDGGWAKCMKLPKRGR